MSLLYPASKSMSEILSEIIKRLEALEKKASKK